MSRKTRAGDWGRHRLCHVTSHKNLAMGGYYLGNHPPLSHKEGRDQRLLGPSKDYIPLFLCCMLSPCAFEIFLTLTETKLWWQIGAIDFPVINREREKSTEDRKRKNTL